jgi:hypothetical protein
MADLDKAVGQSKKLAGILGLRVTRPDRFIAIVVAITASVALISAAVGAGYWWVEQAKAGFSEKLAEAHKDFDEKLVAANKALEARLTEATKGLDEKLAKATQSFNVKMAAAATATGVIDKKHSASATQVDDQIRALWERFSKDDARFEALTETLAELRTDVNGMSNWLPIPIRFGDATSQMRFTLPIPEGYEVSALFLVEQTYKAEFEKNVVIKVNGTPLESPNQYVSATIPQKVAGDWVEGDNQDFEVSLRSDNAVATFEKIKNGNIALLVVVKRDESEEAPRTAENVPGNS